jgi:hypothetical protein
VVPCSWQKPLGVVPCSWQATVHDCERSAASQARPKKDTWHATALVAAMYALALRSRERRFESCRGHHSATSEYSALTSLNGQPHGLPSTATMRHETPRSDAFRSPYAPQRSFRVVPVPLAAPGGVFEVEGLVHAGDPHVFQSGHAPGVDAHQHLDAVSRPGGNLSRGHPGVEPPGDPGVAQIVGPAQKRGGRLGGGECTSPGSCASSRSPIAPPPPNSSTDAQEPERPILTATLADA